MPLYKLTWTGADYYVEANGFYPALKLWQEKTMSSGEDPDTLCKVAEEVIRGG